MTPSRARQFLTELALVLGVELPERRREYYVEALADADDRLAQAVFTRLVKRSRKFPTVAEILEAFEIEAEEQGGTREVRRSAPSPERRAREQVALARWLELEPVMHHSDLYWGYVQALREYREGLRTREELEQVRRAVIHEAHRRAEEAKARAAVSAQSQQAPQPDTGIAASLPRGDRE